MKEQIDAINHPEHYRENGFHTTSNGSGNQGPLPQNVKKNLELMKIGKTSRSCPICIVDFGPNEIVFRLPCKHLFHKACLDPWLQKNKTCACCRMDLEKYFKENQSTLKAPTKTQSKVSKPAIVHGSKTSNPGEQPSTVYMSNIHGIDAAQTQPSASKPARTPPAPKSRNTSSSKRPPQTAAHPPAASTTTPAPRTAVPKSPQPAAPRPPNTNTQQQQQAQQRQQTAAAHTQTQAAQQQQQRADPTAADGGFALSPLWQPIALPGFGEGLGDTPEKKENGAGVFRAPSGPNPYL